MIVARSSIRRAGVGTQPVSKVTEPSSPRSSFPEVQVRDLSGLLVARGGRPSEGTTRGATGRTSWEKSL